MKEAPPTSYSVGEALGSEIRKQRDEIERLRKLVEEAYKEGWRVRFSVDMGMDWLDSGACKRLMEEK